MAPFMTIITVFFNAKTECTFWKRKLEVKLIPQKNETKLEVKLIPQKNETKLNESFKCMCMSCREQ